MKPLFYTLLVSLSLAVSAQDGITFKVEKLSKPKELLVRKSSQEIYKELILLANVPYGNKKERDEYPFQITAHSGRGDSLVSFGYHSFFKGMYKAYADHRPFVLSPDMVWLLICQGFARHVNAQPEKMRDYFVNFSGRLSLVVHVNEEFTLDNPDAPWETVFPQFTEQIGKYTGGELIELLTSDFSTTTAIEKVASEITIMESMKSYFEYVLVMVGCGIPEITLTGTTQDWQKVLDKTRRLAKYDLAWWTSELEPILKGFVKASQGKVDKGFWKEMFKYHTLKKYGAPTIVDGWIVRFFPYDKDGKRFNLKEIRKMDALPDEIVKVDLTYIDVIEDKKIPLELWAGFVGLDQDAEHFTLTPKIGWMLRLKDGSDELLKQKLDSEATSGFGIDIRVIELPEALYELKEIKRLRVRFLDGIRIPDRFASVKIGYLRLSGEIDKEGIKRLEELFPYTKLEINGKSINVPKEEPSYEQLRKFSLDD